MHRVFKLVTDYSSPMLYSQEYKLNRIHVYRSLQSNFICRDARAYIHTIIHLLKTKQLISMTRGSITIIIYIRAFLRHSVIFSRVKIFVDL